MDLLDTQINPADAEFRGNASRMESLVAELRAQLTQARAGGGERYLQRHREQGKLPARERINRLLDPGSPLLSYRHWRPGTCTTTKLLVPDW